VKISPNGLGLEYSTGVNTLFWLTRKAGGNFSGRISIWKSSKCTIVSSATRERHR